MVVKVGRKSYWDVKIQPRLEEIKGWARDGLMDKQIAELLDVGESTFLRWKSLKKELRDTLKVNKQIADLQVENALRDRALGYEYEEEVEEFQVGPDGKKLIKANKKKIKKRLPPDVTAQIFWLKNRQPDKWRDRKHTEHSGNVKVSHENWIDKLHEQD